MSIFDLHFIRPLWLMALVLVVPVAWLLVSRGPATGDWRRVIDPQLYAAIDEAAKFGRPRWLDLLLASIVFAIIALAGPSLHKSERQVAQNAAVRIIALDISRSMRAGDIAPSRMIRAKAAVREILKTDDGARIAFLAFAGGAWTVAPLTRDTATLENMLAVLEPGVAPVQGSRPELALSIADKIARRAGVEQAHIIMFCDGFRAGIPVVKDAGSLAGRGLTVSVVASGTADGARIPDVQGGWYKDFKGNEVVARSDIGKLKAVADAGQGGFITLEDAVRSPESLLQMIADVEAGFVRETDEADSDEQTEVTWRDDGPWLLLPVLLLLAVCFRRGWLFVLPIACTAAFGLAPQPAQADLAGWFLRDDQRTARALEREDYERAALHAPSASWRGAIAYRRDDMQAAIDHYAQGDEADDHYNRANALAMSLRFADATEAYNAALERDPDHADALHNRDLVRALLAKQRAQEKGAESGFDDVQDNSDSREGGFGGDAERKSENDEGSGDEENASDIDRALAELNDSEQAEGDPNVTAQYSEDPALEQREVEIWLSRVPDDPGGFIRRRFRVQQNGAQSSGNDGHAW